MLQSQGPLGEIAAAENNAKPSRRKDDFCREGFAWELTDADVRLSGCSGHLAAFLRAVPTRLSASLAVLRVMFLAFRTTRIADLGADAANFAGELRAATHEGRGTPTDFSTIPVEPDALGHHADILFAQTGVGTVFAFLRALHARFNT